MLGHLQLAGVTAPLSRFDSLATLNDDLRSTNSSMIKQRFIQAGKKKGPQDRKKKPELHCNSCLILTVQDRQVAQAEALARYFGLVYNN